MANHHPRHKSRGISLPAANSSPDPSHKKESIAPQVTDGLRIRALEIFQAPPDRAGDALTDWIDAERRS